MCPAVRVGVAVAGRGVAVAGGRVAVGPAVRVGVAVGEVVSRCQSAGTAAGSQPGCEVCAWIQRYSAFW